MPDAISWDTIEDALQAMVVALTGIPGNRVIWTYQGGKAAAYPYIGLQIDGIRGIGQPWKVKTFDAELDQQLVSVRQHQMAVFTIQYFADSAGTAGQVARAPMSALANIEAGIDLYEYEIDEAGCGIGEISPVQFVSPGGGGILQARSIVTIALHLASELERYEDYVERWKLTATAEDFEGNTIAERTFWTPAPSSFSSGFSTGFELGGGDPNG